VSTPRRASYSFPKCRIGVDLDVVVVDDFDVNGDVNLAATVDGRTSTSTLPSPSRSTPTTTTTSMSTIPDGNELAPPRLGTPLAWASIRRRLAERVERAP
jgi:hypothetical protein